MDVIMGFSLFTLLMAYATFGQFWWLLLPILPGFLVPTEGVIWWLAAAAAFFLVVFLHGYSLGFCDGPGACLAPFPAFPMWFVSLIICAIIGLARFPRRLKPGDREPSLLSFQHKHPLGLSASGCTVATPSGAR